ncbi:MAG: radical SAM protein [bacterium]|nr:radical SAM protein [bacterium]
MKILLIKPIGKRFEDEQYYIDIGQGFLGTALKKAGHDVRILDCMREKLSWKKFERFVRENPYDFYAIKAYSWAVQNANRTIEIIRKHNPGALIGVGGPHPSGAAEEVFEHIPGMDFAWQGEAEIHLPQFLGKMEVQSSKFKVQSAENKNQISPFTIDLSPSTLAGIPGLIYRAPEGVKANPPYFHENIDDLGYPDWELLGMEKYIRTSRKIRFLGNYYIPVVTSRGCPNACTYCAAWRLSGKKIRRHSIEYVIGWITELKKRYGIDFFAFVDDALTADREYFVKLLEEIIRRDLKIHWDCAQNAVRFDNLDEEMLQLMERSGCFYMTIAAESGSPSTLKAMNRKVDLDLVREKVDLIKRTTHILVQGYFILGYPTDTWEDLKTTTRFSRELSLDAVQYFLFTPHPGSEIYRRLRAEGKLPKINWKRWHYGDVSVPLKDVSRETLNFYHRWAYFRFYNQRRFIVGHPQQAFAPVELDWIRDARSLIRAFLRELAS